MILIDVSVKSIGAALGHQLELAAARWAGGGQVAADYAVKLLHRVDRRVSNNGAGTESVDDSGAYVLLLRRPSGREIVHIQAIQRDVILVDASTGNSTSIRHAGLHREQCSRIISRLYGKVIELLHVKRIADGRVSGIQGDLRI